ncbi:unnamed protein product [Meloidogyne enterolobii]|uniref:Uncharacterized protein n=1 Tax=Meloidogyne enterolobii TaxID=390850 RepID=A0ACB0YGY3_MELEN
MFLSFQFKKRSRSPTSEPVKQLYDLPQQIAKLNEYMDEMESLTEQILQTKEEIEQKNQQLEKDKEQFTEIHYDFITLKYDPPFYLINTRENNSDQIEQLRQRIYQTNKNYNICLDENSSKSNLQHFGRKWKRFFPWK